MLRFIMMFSLLTTLLFGQGIYFCTLYSTPSNDDGHASIVYNFCHEQHLVVYSYYAKLHYPPGSPEGTSSAWIPGETGGWWVTKAGTYQVEGKAYVQSIFGGSAYWTYRSPVNITVIDNNDPLAPQDVEITAYNNHPKIEWLANSEHDLGYYKIFKKDGGNYNFYASTTNTTYIDWDEEVVTGQQQANQKTIFYNVKSVDINENSSLASDPVSIIVEGEPQYKLGNDEINKAYNLKQNYPNPFNPSTTLEYNLKEDGFVIIKIFDALGKEVAKLVNENQEAGSHQVNFDAKNLPSGIYIYTISVNNFVQTRKMTLIK